MLAISGAVFSRKSGQVSKPNLRPVKTISPPAIRVAETIARQFPDAR
jgi:hypothetical protein